VVVRFLVDNLWPGRASPTSGSAVGAGWSACSLRRWRTRRCRRRRTRCRAHCCGSTGGPASAARSNADSIDHARYQPIFFQHGPVIRTDQVKSLNAQPSSLPAHLLEIHSAAGPSSTRFPRNSRDEDAARNALLNPALSRRRLHVVSLLWIRWTVERRHLRCRHVVSQSCFRQRQRSRNPHCRQCKRPTNSYRRQEVSSIHSIVPSESKPCFLAEKFLAVQHMKPQFGVVAE